MDLKAIATTAMYTIIPTDTLGGGGKTKEKLGDHIDTLYAKK